MTRLRARRPPGTLALVVLLSTGAAVAVPGRSEARSVLDLPWPLKDVFPIAVRFVRVDRNCKVTDRDEATGYIVFECTEEGTKVLRRGALELIAPTADKDPREGRATCKAQLTLSDEPRYMELRFLELLERKIRDERGPAVPRPTPPPPPPSPPDAGR